MSAASKPTRFVVRCLSCENAEETEGYWPARALADTHAREHRHTTEVLSCADAERVLYRNAVTARFHPGEEEP